MLPNKTALIFGALLHDVGKVVYRGDSTKGTHSELGATFISEEVAAQNDGFDVLDGSKIVEQIRFHHAIEMTKAIDIAPDSLAWITYFADNISAGMDRKNEGDEAQKAVFDKDTELRKIFNIINGRKDDNTISHDDYNSIRERIKSGLIGIEVSKQGVNSLLNLLEVTTDKVPSSTNMTELVDVSLFDHAKTTAGIASCIFEYLAEQQISDYKAALFDKEKSQEFYAKQMFLLFSCDMSGIQNFIYNISGEGALKQLRARSLYLEMMLEHIADELLERLDLSRANLLYTGGGHAYLLLPNTEYVKNAIKSFTEELQDWFISQHRTDLYLADAWIECSADDLSNRGEDKQRYRNLYRKLSEKLSTVKASRYSAATIAELNFGTSSAIDHERECVECHRSDLHIDSNRKCTICAALATVSPRLVKKDVFVVSEETDNDTVSIALNSLPLPFNKRLSVYSREEYFSKLPDYVRIYTKNSWDTGINLATHIWMGDYTYEMTNEGISSYASDGITLIDKKGINRLGVLRADVDNLGTIFTNGLPDEKISISRTSTLSRSLSYFFKYWINEVLKVGEYRAQIIYSGGDDLFIVGNWSDIIYAAIDIRNALDEFTGNGTLTISAGVGMYDSKYPIARMASETGDLEDTAKRYPNTLGQESPGQMPTKNAIALWSSKAVFSWSEFIEDVQVKMSEITRVFNHNEKGKAFIYKLINLLRATEENISIPRLAYLLARSFEDDMKNGAHTTKAFYEWATDANERRYLITALEWYVYSIRERG